VFPFSNEPFGYVPLESMSCGTPVLTYNREGPSETVVDGQTGWLVGSPEEFVRVGSRLWKLGFDRGRFQDACLQRAALFQPGSQARALAELLLHRSRS
jgi:glycosyltransferase involved in cell wall biosynthesis